MRVSASIATFRGLSAVDAGRMRAPSAQPGRTGAVNRIQRDPPSAERGLTPRTSSSLPWSSSSVSRRSCLRRASTKRPRDHVNRVVMLTFRRDSENTPEPFEECHGLFSAGQTGAASGMCRDRGQSSLARHCAGGGGDPGRSCEGGAQSGSRGDHDSTSTRVPANSSKRRALSYPPPRPSSVPATSRRLVAEPSAGRRESPTRRVPAEAARPAGGVGAEHDHRRVWTPTESSGA